MFFIIITVSVNNNVFLFFNTQLHNNYDLNMEVYLENTRVVRKTKPGPCGSPGERGIDRWRAQMDGDGKSMVRAAYLNISEGLGNDGDREWIRNHDRAVESPGGAKNFAQGKTFLLAPRLVEADAHCMDEAEEEMPIPIEASSMPIRDDDDIIHRTRRVRGGKKKCNLKKSHSRRKQRVKKFDKTVKGKSSGKREFRECISEATSSTNSHSLFQDEAACSDGSADELIDTSSEPDTEDDDFIDSRTHIPDNVNAPRVVQPGTTFVVPEPVWGLKDEMSPEAYWDGPRLTGPSKRGNRGDFSRSKHFLFTFPGRRPGEEVRMVDCVEWAKLVGGTRYKSCIVAWELAPTTYEPHFHIYLQLTATGEPCRCYHKDVNLFGRHGDVKAGYTDRTDWIRKYCEKDGTFVADGIAIETYLEAKKLKKSEILLRIIDQGSFREQDLREFPALLERTSNIHDGLLALKQMQAAVEFNAAWRAPDHLYAWQRDLLDGLKDVPSDRCVKWVVDAQGGRGKSRISSLLQKVACAAVFTDFNKNNIVFAYECQPVVVLDLPRCSDVSDPRLYALVEGFIDGKLFNHKYRSKQLLFARPHVIVFSNEEPTRECLSADRWRQLKVLGDASRGPFMPRGDMELVTYDWSWIASGTGLGRQAYAPSTSVPVAFRNVPGAGVAIVGNQIDVTVDDGRSVPPGCDGTGPMPPEPQAVSGTSTCPGSKCPGNDKLADLSTQRDDR
jgi:hypothetical protein